METKYFFCDTETTGTDPKRHGIIQIAGLIYTREDDAWDFKESIDIKVQPFPADEIDDSALEVSGVTREALQDRLSPKVGYVRMTKTLGQYVDKFNRADKMIFAGYNARFDFDMLRAFWQKNGDNYFGSWFYFPPIDVMNLAAVRLIRSRHLLKDFKLATVSEHFKIEPEGNLHDALADVLVTKQLFDICESSK